MRRKILWAAAGGCLVLAIVIVCLYAGVFGKRPFKDLDSADISSAAVELMPPDVSLNIPETEKLAELLSSVVIYRQDDSYKDYAGQAVVFTITMRDGTVMKITEFTPFVIIDGIAYKAKYEPCQALNSFANAFLSESEG